jgi:NAD(P)-dependent dehydrogenase (short-subunit alcohol dehydrogenase family)
MMHVLRMFDLKGKAAIVTGGGQGIGRELALGLAEAGANVVVVQRRLEIAEETAQEIEKLGVKGIALKVDVSVEEDVEKMVKTTVNTFGRLDIMVNNAGIAQWVAAEDMSLEDWNKMISINLTGVFLGCKHAGRVMISRKEGSIINLTSMSGQIVNSPQKQSHYNSAKGGANLLTKCLAFEWAEHNVRVNAIAPGYVATPLLKLADPGIYAQWTEKTAQKRIPEPSELKGIVVFLASEASSYVTGHILVADGGYTLT